jgi:hypothetical protein
LLTFWAQTAQFDPGFGAVLKAYLDALCCDIENFNVDRGTSLIGECYGIRWQAADGVCES